MHKKITRRELVKLMASGAVALSGCSYLRIDVMSPYIRSDSIDSPERLAEILKGARLSTTDDGRMKVLYVTGNAYQRGFQHGYLLRKEVQDNMGYLYEQGKKKFRSAELFDEGYERMRPYIPQEYVDEMHGLAHGSKLPLQVIHAVHALPEIGEWGGKKKLKKIVQQMMDGELGTSCSNLAASGSATIDGGMYVVRILDWGLHKISKLHQNTQITINIPDKGVPSANIGWTGFLGAISGMNAKGITLGEMGYGDPPGESLAGKPMPFLLREVLNDATNLADVRRIISSSEGTNSFVYLMSDGKTREAELYVRDRSRFRVFKPGQEIDEEKHKIPPVNSVVYGGHDSDIMGELLQSQHGKISKEMLMKELIPKFALKSNFQNVVYDPVNLRFWVNNAVDKKTRAAEQEYTFFDFKAALGI